MSINLHEGHREKMRDRFIRDKGFENFEDHQILELLLFYANPRGDTNPVAHKLLDTFGSMKGVLEARPEQLIAVEGVGKQAATLISMVVPLTRVWHRCAMEAPEKIGNNSNIKNSCCSQKQDDQSKRPWDHMSFLHVITVL